MPSVQKFLFDESFDAGPPPEVIEVAQAEILQNQAYQSALEDAKSQSHTLASQGLQVIAAKLDEIKAIEESHLSQIGEEAASLAVVALQKLYPALAEKGGLDEVKKAFESASQSFQDQKEITFFVHPNLVEDTKVFVAEAKTPVRISVEGDPMLEVTDCRLSWDQGGVERYVKWMAYEISKLLLSTANMDLIEKVNNEVSEAAQVENE